MIKELHDILRENPEIQINIKPQYNLELDVRITNGNRYAEFVMGSHEMEKYEDDMDDLFLHRIETSIDLVKKGHKRGDKV